MMKIEKMEEPHSDVPAGSTALTVYKLSGLLAQLLEWTVPGTKNIALIADLAAHDTTLFPLLRDMRPPAGREK
jgi:hypothetical protein